jgi:hypothetical protein
MKPDQQNPLSHFMAAIRSNALYLLVFMTISLALGSALFAGPLLPWRDLPDHLALISLLDHARLAGSVAADHYQLQWLPVPYWLFYGSVWLIASLTAWTTAVQIVAFGGMIATPIALGRLIKALGRDPRWGLIVMPLFFNHNLMYGWVSYCLGIPVLFMATAAAIRRLDGLSGIKPLAAWSCLLFLAHAQLAAFFALIVFYLVLSSTKDRLWHRVKTLGVPLIAPVLLGLPWVIARLMGQHSRGEVTSGAALIFHDPVTRLKRLPDFLTNCWSGNQDDWMGLATIAAIVLLSRLPNLRAIQAVAPQRSLASGLVLLTAALYFIAPWEIRWPTNQWAIYNRFAILTAMTSAILIDVPFPNHLWRDRRWPALWILALWLIPVSIFAGRNHEVYTDFNMRNAFVLETVRSLPSNERILPLIRDAGDPASHLGAADQFHAYYIIEHGGYDPYLFDNPSHPVVHRARTKPPMPPWNQPFRHQALKALEAWSASDLGKERPFNLVIEQDRRSSKQRLSPAFDPPKQSGRWVIHQRGIR